MHHDLSSRDADRQSGENMRTAPRRSTLEIVRQFARCYQPQLVLGQAAFASIIVN